MDLVTKWAQKEYEAKIKKIKDVFEKNDVKIPTEETGLWDKVKELKQYVGKEVSIEVINKDGINTIEDILKRSDPQTRYPIVFTLTVENNPSIKFLGDGSAIKSISVDDEVVYLNEFLGETYNASVDEARVMVDYLFS